jgi:RHS repeat-associated protein
LEDKEMNTSKSSTRLLAICVLTIIISALVYAQDKSNEMEMPLPKALGKPRSINVSTAFGTVSDSIPIIVPPGRRNVEPHLFLSSNLGWQLDTGRVSRWRGDGTPTVGDPCTFSYNIAGAGGQLVPTDDTNVYHAKLETVYREFRRLGDQPDDGWTMSNGEGVLHRFGSTPESRIEDIGGRGQLWMLDFVMDRSGNTITYSYERVHESLYPKEIRYTGFIHTGDLGANRITFEYEVRPDERISYNNTVRAMHTRRLKRISIFSGESLTRRYELEYEQNPVNGQSLLKHILLVGADDVSKITLRTIDYRARELGWSGEPLSGSFPVDLADSEGGETGARVVDVDGDGFADVLDNGENVYLGDGQGNFERDASWSTSLKNAGIQFIEPSGDYKGVDKGVRLIDVNADGLPDLFIAQLDRQEILLNTGSGWSLDSQWTTNLQSLKPHAAVDPCYSELDPSEFSDEDIEDLNSLAVQLQDHNDGVSQFLWDRFDANTQQLLSDFNEANPDHQPLREALVRELGIVINGDLIYDPNRFANVTLSDDTELLLEQNPTGAWLFRLNRLLLEDAYPDAIKKRYTAPVYSKLHDEYEKETFAFVEKDGVSKGIELAELNGDGRIDILWSADRSDVMYWGKKQIPILLSAVFLNTGSGWEKDMALTQKLRYYSFVSDSQLNGYSVMNVNGDSFGDIVRTFKGEGEEEAFQEIFLGTGNGWVLEDTYSNSLVHNEIFSIVEVDGKRVSQGLMPIDFDDDGLVDYLWSNETVVQSYHNTGTGWKVSPDMTTELTSIGVAFNTADGNATGVVLGDIDGDGLSDVIKAKEGEPNQIWLSSSLRSGLMVRTTSALGEVTEVEWASSTSFDNKIDGVQRLPSSMPVVTKLTRHDGRGSAYETTYEYKGGLFEDRQFRGFRWTQQLRPGGLRVETLHYQQEGLTGQTEIEQGYDSKDQLRTRRSSEYITMEAQSGKVTQFLLVGTDEQVIDPEGIRHSSIRNTFDKRLNYISVWRNPDIDIEGDETTTLFSWVYNEEAGIWSLPARTCVLQGQDGPILSEFIMLYDNLPEGQADEGLASKRMSLVEARESWEQGTYLIDKIMVYDEYGNIISLEDGEGNISTFEYDQATSTFRTRAVDPEGRVVECGYHAGFGEFLWDKDASNNLTHKTYDTFGRLVKLTMPGDEQSPFGTRFFEYSDLGDAEAQWYLIKETEMPGDDGTLDKMKFFDGMARLYRVEQEGAMGKTVVSLTEYDDADNPVATSRPFFKGEEPPWTSIERDDLHRPVRIVEPDGIELTATYTGRRVDIVDRRGSHTTYYRNAEGQTTAIHQWIDGAENVTSYGYDPLGRLTTICDALGEVTRISYNAIGWRIRLEDPGAGTYNYSYDGEGRLVEQTAPDGQTTYFYYNGAGDLIRKEFPDGTTHIFTYGTTQNSNTAGRVVQIKDSAGIVDLRYDARGNVVERRRKVLGRTYVTGYNYDSLGRIYRLTYPDGFVVHYTYDEGDNLAQVTDSQGRAIAQNTEYNAAGQLNEMIFGNEVRSRFTYDELLRMTSIRTLTGSDQVLQSLDYTYDPGGNIKSITDLAFGNSQTFDYDAIGRLTKAVGAYGDEVYEYDAIGNLLRKGNMVFTVDPDHPQRVIRGQQTDWKVLPGRGLKNNPKVAKFFDIAYDIRGNVTEKGSRRFEYDSENHLIRVSDGVGRMIEENVYDSCGQRGILKTRDETTIFIDGIYEEGKTHTSRHVRAGSLLVATIVTPRATVQLIKEVPEASRAGYTGFGGPWSWGFIALAGIGLAIWLLRSGIWRSLLDAFVGFITEIRRRPKTVSILLLLIVSMVQVPVLKADCRTSCNNRIVLVLSHEPALVSVLLGTPSYKGPEFEKRYYYHSNHLGSVNVVTDDRVKVVERRDYKPYGERFEWTGPESGPRELLQTFNSHRYDDATGLYYFGARHYDAELGRFLTADTLIQDPLNPKTLHRYAFAGGNPIRYTDPTGHAWYDWVIGIIVIVVVVAVAVTLTVVTCGALAPASFAFAFIVGATIIGAGLGAAAMGVYALTRGASVFSSDFWMAMAGGAVIGAAIGAAIGSLPASLGFTSWTFATSVGFFAGLAADVFVGAVLGGLGPVVAHLAKGGGPEDILTEKLGYDIATAAIKGALYGLLTGAQLNLIGMASKGWKAFSVIYTGVLIAEGVGEDVSQAFVPGHQFSFLNVFGWDNNWFNNSPITRLGIPSWAFAGTWVGSGRSEVSAVLQTMPLCP